MIYPDKKSALVRLTDSLKVTLDSCADTTADILDIFKRNKSIVDNLREVARRVQREELPYSELQRANAAMPQDEAQAAAYLQLRLHGHALAAVLLSCFCLESYINSLAYFLFGEADYLGLTRKRHTTSADAILDAIERMTARTKWDFLGGLGPGAGFDKSRAPYQDFDVLYRFRDDHVHDKMRDFSEDFGQRRYRGKLPDPVFGILSLEHGLFAAETYWEMVLEVHHLLDLPAQRFHRHYNLTPWRDGDGKSRLRALVLEYQQARL